MTNKALNLTSYYGISKRKSSVIKDTDKTLYPIGRSYNVYSKLCSSHIAHKKLVFNHAHKIRPSAFFRVTSRYQNLSLDWIALPHSSV